VSRPSRTDRVKPVLTEPAALTLAVLIASAIQADAHAVAQGHLPRIRK
jgi:hypothetical protein